MAGPDVWHHALGRDLWEVRESGQPLSVLLPEVPGIYLWKFALIPGIVELSDPAAFVDWLDAVCKTPQGRTIEQQVAHYARIGGIELRGQGLPSEKRALFLQVLASAKGRRWMTEFLRGVQQHMPALYVGEAENIALRTKQHLNGESDFGAYIFESPVLAWPKLNLYYVRLQNADEQRSSSVRKALEYFAAVVSIAGFTRRPG